MEINCGKIAENYLLIQNPLYSFSFPIAILVAIIIFGCAKAYKWSNNSYVNQILIPVLALLLTMVLLDIISRLMISKDEKMKVTQMCNKWINSQNIDINIDIDVENFTDKKKPKSPPNPPNPSKQPKKIQDFLKEYDKKKNSKKKVVEKMENMNSTEQVIDPIAEIRNISPSPIPFKPNGQMCIQDSNSCNLCSGSGQNPYNLIAPIPIPGPQWLPESAATVQNKLKNNIYTNAKCPVV
jgi:hypothetical protein